MRDDVNDASIKVFNDEIAKLEKERETLSQQIDNVMARDDILTQSFNLAEKWRKAGFQTRKTMLNALVESILIHKRWTALNHLENIRTDRHRPCVYGGFECFM